MAKIGYFVFMLFCFISFAEWHDQNNAAKEFLPRRINFFVGVKAVEGSSSPLKKTSSKLNFKRRELYDDQYCNPHGCNLQAEVSTCPDQCHCGVVRCTQSIASDYSVVSDSTNSRRLKLEARQLDEEYCNAYPCSLDPADADECPATCFCGVYKCAPEGAED